LQEQDSLKNLRAGQFECWVSQTRITRLQDLPWGRYSEETLSLRHVAEALNESHHHGLDDVKMRILEFMAKAVLLGGVPKGTVICLVGPPRVGKTSIAKAIAKAENFIVLASGHSRMLRLSKVINGCILGQSQAKSARNQMGECFNSN
jgi:ATP-dependent Lon protease